MKRIALISKPPHDSAAIFTSVLGHAPLGQPFNLEEVRKRVRVLDIIEKLPEASEYLDLEDADHAVLANALRTTPYNIASAQVLAIVDAALDAKAPPVEDKAAE